jgi:hypothetical protein
MPVVPRLSHIAHRFLRYLRFIIRAPDGSVSSRGFLRPVAIAVSVAVAVAAFAAASAAFSRDHGFRWRVRLASGDYSARAARSAGLLEHTFYNGTGLWHMCAGMRCSTKNRDWGSDSLTYALWFRWRLTSDPAIPPLIRTLAKTAHAWVRGDKGSSDTVMWDSIANSREYQVTRSKVALAKAKAAFAWVDSVMADGFGSGACPDIDYQWPHGEGGNLKTLETATNYIKAALLLHQITGSASYLAKAQAQYKQVRRYFLTGNAPLYTVYVFDNGKTCRALAGRYFASVNGNMIWAGVALAANTGDRRYLREAIATAHAVRSQLSDSAGIYADLQADNDVVEPLIEGMYTLATTEHQAFARSWLLSAASAAGADQNAAGEFGRFFDGPPPTSVATAWQINGGVALIQAAAALDPHGRPADPRFWRHARYVTDARDLDEPALRISFTGRAIAIMGSVGAQCCIAGHARVFVDGTETFDRTGIWQNMTSPSIQQPDQVLFAWRWQQAGPHTIMIKPGIRDTMEGGSFFAMNGYLLVR